MHKINLAYPRDKGLIAQNKSRFQWGPYRPLHGPENIRYALTLFATPRGKGSQRRGKPKAVFIRRGLKKNFVDITASDQGLQPGVTYWWQVKACNKDGEILGMSKKHKFKVEKPVEMSPIMEVRHPGLERDGYVVMDKNMLATISVTSLLEQLLPSAPMVWGKPVKVRARSALDELEPSETPLPEEGPGELEPQPLVWGGVDAGEIYLPVQMASSCSVFWDQSRIDGCESVLFQVSGQDGFSEPNNGNVMDDAAVINYYWGPPRISCGSEELEGPTGPPPFGFLIPSTMVNLFDRIDGEATVMPSDSVPEVVRQVRVIPCNADREQVDVASDPFTVYIVRYPSINIGAAVCDWHWGDNPSREITFSLFFEGRYPDVNTIPAPTAPCTLLIYTRPGPVMLDDSTCEHISLTMNGEVIERRNRILIQSGRDHLDMFVIGFDEWPTGSGFDCTLHQQWQGGILPLSLDDFLEPMICAMVIPGIRPDQMYCGGVANGFDSLYGRDDLADDEITMSPFYRHPGACLPDTIIDGWTLNGLLEFNDFMSGTFHGTRTVSFDGSASSIDDPDVDEVEGTQDVTVNFEAAGSSDLRYVMPRLHEPVMMHEQRESGEVIWQVVILDGKYASLRTTGRSFNLIYSGRTGELAGTSRFDPPRMEIWLSVRLGMDSSYRTVWADIHYDLTAD